MVSVEETAAWFDGNLEDLKKVWFGLLRLKTVGADPAFADECAECAELLAGMLKKLGFSVSIRGEGSGSVFGFRPADPGADGRTVLLYGHYDVQPADPVEEWRTDPWNPVEIDGRVYARGAQDNKGQLSFVLAALRFCVETGVPLPNLKVVIDGQEESGSEALSSELRTSSQDFSADAIMVSDTEMYAGRPTICAGLRGVCGVSLRLNGASHDLHSGTHGGIAPNPAAVAAAAVAALHDADGAPSLSGFTDGMLPPDPGEVEMCIAGGFDENEYLLSTGTLPSGGQSGFHPAVRGALLPTIEVNGFHSGYGGAGLKTIIPSFAEVKITMRLCPGQNAESCVDALKLHFEKFLKPGMTMSVTAEECGGGGFRVPLDSPAVDAARRILDGLGLGDSVIHWDGASIPVVGRLYEATGAAVIMAGFGSDEDRIHSPNESFAVRSGRLLFEYVCRMLSWFGECRRERPV